MNETTEEDFKELDKTLNKGIAFIVLVFFALCFILFIVKNWFKWS